MQDLITWKNSTNRKPLILTGIRQCGKTFILKEFGNQHYSRHHYINFEKQTTLHEIFSRDLDPHKLIQELSLSINKDIDIKHDLVIFDEIQACPPALTSLKYFNEEMPQLQLCTAGSLLGVALNNVSFPVGQVNHLTLYPMSFLEFLLALEKDKLCQAIQDSKDNYALSQVAHQQLWELMKYYWISGGLPEVVKTFIANQDNILSAFTQVRKKQEELIFTYYGDIAKHSGKVNAMHIDRVWRNIPKQLSISQDQSAKKFQFKNIVPGIDRYSRLAGAIDWLDASGLIIKIPIINNCEIPLSAYSVESKFKCFLADVGLLGAMINLPFDAILSYDFGTYKGYFAENFVAQELKTKNTGLYSWQDKRNEVEFVLQHNNGVLPIEVKSGWITKAKSLDKFKQKYNPSFTCIMSGHQLKIDKKNDIHHYPLYLASLVPY